MNNYILATLFMVSCAINLTAQVNMQEDAQALLQTCVRNTKNIDPVACTDREIMKIAVAEVKRIAVNNKPNTIINLNIQIAVNERGTITEVLVNNNQNTLENLVSKKLQAMEPLFPARKNGVFIASVLTYHIDDATLTDFVLLDNSDRTAVPSNEVIIPAVMPNITDSDPEFIEVIPFIVMQEPPSTKKCAVLETLAAKQTCFIEFTSSFIDKPLRKYLEKNKMNENLRIMITFIIDKNGNAVDIKIRTKDPAIEKQIRSIMKKFPQVIPGKQRGRVVSTQFTTFYKS